MSLFDGKALVPKKAKKARTPKQQNAEAIVAIRDAYVAAFERRWGFTPKGGAKSKVDWTRLRDLEETWGVEEVLRLVEVFFTTTDPKVTRGDYSVQWFSAMAQQLKLNSQRGALQDERTAANVDAIARATGRKG